MKTLLNFQKTNLVEMFNNILKSVQTNELIDIQLAKSVTTSAKLPDVLYSLCHE